MYIFRFVVSQGILKAANRGTLTGPEVLDQRFVVLNLGPFTQDVSYFRMLDVGNMRNIFPHFPCEFFRITISIV